MICPYCSTGIRLTVAGSSIVHDESTETKKQYGFDIAHGFCPECERLIVLIRRGSYWEQGHGDYSARELNPDSEEIIYPNRKTKPVPSEVPERFRKAFLEAFACLSVSPNASAAVSRRLLQDVLENSFGASTGSNLAGQIDVFVARADIPTFLAEQIDAVRRIGNFAAHPLKNTHTGEVLDVEPGEADWLIGALEALFDFAFVQPERLRKQRCDLNAKLAAAGKPPLK